MEYRESLLNGIVEDVFFNKGYSGTSKLAYATGKPAVMLEDERTDTHPWSIVLEHSGVTTDTEYNMGTAVCAFKRDFQTALSDIQIKVGDIYKVMVGYKMYLHKEWHEPNAKGHSGDRMLEW